MMLTNSSLWLEQGTMLWRQSAPPVAAAAKAAADATTSLRVSPDVAQLLPLSLPAGCPKHKRRCWPNTQPAGQQRCSGLTAYTAPDPNNPIHRSARSSIRAGCVKHVVQLR
jgi:hypothetical protein